LSGFCGRKWEEHKLLSWVCSRKWEEHKLLSGFCSRKWEEHKLLSGVSTPPLYMPKVRHKTGKYGRSAGKSQFCSCQHAVPVQSILWPPNCFPAPAHSALSLLEFVDKKKVTVASLSTPSILIRFSALWLFSSHKTQGTLKETFKRYT
jgi:hypothetical protein